MAVLTVLRKVVLRVASKVAPKVEKLAETMETKQAEKRVV
jgi:hypothetical protein